MKLALSLSAMLAACALASCGSGSPPRPPSDAAVAAALATRVNGPYAPEMAIRASAEDASDPPCGRSYRVERVGVRQTPLGAAFAITANYQVTRLTGPGVPDADPFDCFGVDSSTPTVPRTHGGPAPVLGYAQLTWQRGGYWLLNVGDQYIPLPPG